MDGLTEIHQMAEDIKEIRRQNSMDFLIYSQKMMNQSRLESRMGKNDGN